MSDGPGEVIVRVALLDAFCYGDDAVLVAMNSAGLDALMAALREALDRQVSHLHGHGRTHTLQSRPGTNDIYLHENRDEQVLWRLDPAAIQELVDKLGGMKGKGLCHNYVDIDTPARTLVVSVDEYLVPNDVVHTSPFGYF